MIKKKTADNKQLPTMYNGVYDYSMPIRQYFVNNENTIPSEWTSGDIKFEFVNKFINENKKGVITVLYKKDGINIFSCIISVGRKECLYAFINSSANNIIKHDMQMLGLNISMPEFENESLYRITLLFKGTKTPLIDSIINKFNKLIEKPKKNNLHVISKNGGGPMTLKSQEISCPSIDFSLNYNEDFEQVHNTILNKLAENNSKGLVLLHGTPGTGKTTYIRYLINNIKGDKKIIYIPPNMTNMISDPSFVGFFMDNRNSILIIEDAENILTKRAANSSQSISNILNLSDGLLSDCMNIQIIATFNTNVLNIDEALLRKGRLIAKYEFKELSSDRAEKLKVKLFAGDKKKYSVREEKQSNKSLTLAEIYNSNENNFVESVTKTKLGFLSILLFLFLFASSSLKSQSDSSQTYIAFAPCFTNEIGQLRTKYSPTIEIGKQFDNVFTTGLAFGKTNCTSPHSLDDIYIEFRPNLNVFQLGRFTNTITTGIGYVFGRFSSTNSNKFGYVYECGTNEALMLELTSGIEFDYSSEWHFNVFYGNYNYSSFSAPNPEPIHKDVTFFGFSIVKFLSPSKTKGMFKIK